MNNSWQFHRNSDHPEHKEQLWRQLSVSWQCAGVGNSLAGEEQEKG